MQRGNIQGPKRFRARQMRGDFLAVDDHPVFRSGIAAFLAFQPDMSLVAEASNGRERDSAVSPAPPRHRPDGLADACHAFAYRRPSSQTPHDHREHTVNLVADQFFAFPKGIRKFLSETVVFSLRKRWRLRQ